MYGLIGFKNGAGNEINEKREKNEWKLHTLTNRRFFFFIFFLFERNVENQIDK